MSKFRFQGRLQPPTGESEFYTPPPFRVCPDCDEDLFNEPRYDVPCPNNGTGRIPIYYTVKQWEEMTGRKAPDDMPVWWLGEYGNWNLGLIGCVVSDYVVIANEAGVPPKDWKPE